LEEGASLYRCSKTGTCVIMYVCDSASTPEESLPIGMLVWALLSLCVGVWVCLQGAPKLLFCICATDTSVIGTSEHGRKVPSLSSRLWCVCVCVYVCVCMRERESKIARLQQWCS